MSVTLITGASSGIGEAFARILAAKRHNLVLVARNEAKLSSLCDDLMTQHKITAHYIAIDLNDYKADERLFKETTHHGLEVDWLINNAGFGSMGDFAELRLENEMDMISLNIMALTAITHRYLRPMRKRGSGTIINVSSCAGFQPVPYMSTYAATKAFVTSFSEAIAEENRPYGIDVLALCPGPTETNFFKASEIGTPLKMKGMQSADEVAHAAISAVERKKICVVSGWKNYLGSIAGTIVPDSLITRALGGIMRPRIKKEKRNLDS